MPVTDPSYVTLSGRNALGIVADILGGSRWSISGYDVKPFPPDSNPNAQTFVREMVRRGVLEEASKAEYEEVQDAAQAVLDEHLSNVDLMDKLSKGGTQEGRIQEVVNDRRAKVQTKRAERSADADPEYEPIEGPEEVHHQEGSGEVTHESLAQAQVRADRPETAEGEDGEDTPVQHQAQRRTKRTRS